MAKVNNFLRLVPVLLFCLDIKVITAQRKEISIILDPPVPILYRKLCITPDFYINYEEEELNRIWLADANEATIYMYDATKPSNSERFKIENKWTSRFDSTYNVSTHRICIRNLTNEETMAQFKWKITCLTKGAVSNEIFGEHKINITAAVVKPAGTEISNLRVIFNPAKPILNKELCNKLTYAIDPQYFVNEVVFQAEEKSNRVTVYIFQQNSKNGRNSSYYNETDPWHSALDTTKSNNTNVCFKTTSYNLFNLKYFWRVRIQHVNDNYNMKDKEWPFFLHEGDATIDPPRPGVKTAMSIGAIVGIVFAAAVIIVIIVIIVVWKKRGIIEKKYNKYQVTNNKKTKKKDTAQKDNKLQQEVLMQDIGKDNILGDSHPDNAKKIDEFENI